MKKRVTGMLAAVALLSVLAAGIGGAGAYFTDRAEGSQNHTVRLGDSTTVQENTVDWSKQVTITNSATSDQAVWVRAQAFAGSDIQGDLKYGGTGWTTEADANGWYYYASPVQPGQTAAVLNVQLPDQKIKEKEADEGLKFNVIVVYETTPALDIDGTETAQTADWTAALSS